MSEQDIIILLYKLSELNDRLDYIEYKLQHPMAEELKKQYIAIYSDIIKEYKILETRLLNNSTKTR